jgi:hypothetical protein
MKVKKGQTVYHGGKKYKTGQDIPDHVEKALIEPEKKSVKNESKRTSRK